MTPLPDARNAAVLIGGRSSRMGAPKSMLNSGDRYLLEGIVSAVREAGARATLVGKAPVPPSLSSLPMLTDAKGVEGPLGGVLAALRTESSVWFVLSCDLPFVTVEALRWLAAQRTTDCIAVAPWVESPDMPEPLLALYAPGALARLEEAAERGERSLRRILLGERIVSPRVPDPLRRAWTNVNTPGEWSVVLSAMGCTTKHTKATKKS